MKEVLQLVTTTPGTAQRVQADDVFVPQLQVGPRTLYNICLLRMLCQLVGKKKTSRSIKGDGEWYFLFELN